MKRTVHVLLALLLLVVSCTSKPVSSNQPPTGTWSGDYGIDSERREPIRVDLHWEDNNLNGVVHAGPRSLPLSKASFNADTGSISMEFDAEGNGGRTVHYVIEGKVSANTMMGTWTHDGQRGDFRVSRQ